MKEVTPEDWQKAIPHVIKVKEDYWKKDRRTEIEVEPLIINVEDEEGDDDAEYTDDFDHKSDSHAVFVDPGIPID
ncbi:MAG: hypothetical protein GY821_10180 [Gammaproteobacteria bacterium]|nr:hypothetical protein [Gammaproteobacteria bacterium]